VRDILTKWHYEWSSANRVADLAGLFSVSANAVINAWNGEQKGWEEKPGLLIVWSPLWLPHSLCESVGDGPDVPGDNVPALEKRAPLFATVLALFVQCSLSTYLTRLPPVCSLAQVQQDSSLP
jgi:hypothetical protein